MRAHSCSFMFIPSFLSTSQSNDNHKDEQDEGSTSHSWIPPQLWPPGEKYVTYPRRRVPLKEGGTVCTVSSGVHCPKVTFSITLLTRNQLIGWLVRSMGSPEWSSTLSPERSFLVLVSCYQLPGLGVRLLKRLGPLPPCQSTNDACSIHFVGIHHFWVIHGYSLLT